MIFKRFLVLTVLVLGLTVANGQDISNVRTNLFSINGETILIDSAGVFPNSVKISGFSSADFFMDYPRGVLKWKSIPNVKEVWITYRVMPFSLLQTNRRLSFDSVFYRIGITPDKFSSKYTGQKPVDFGKLNSNGSIGRSLSFGNRQDAILNSSLNLQLNGYMGDSILINAAISDNNIPIQPDGNTQRLNEFDQVYVQFSKDKWRLLVGDQDIRQNELYYLNFYKRLQGISFASETPIGKTSKNELLASGAVAKGKFTRNIFQGIEGNQGPYRLKGANQELFFIVLAGTERVFIDGELLQRGEDQDYVINYNTAEVTFMPKNMITKDKRIQIEFEYADRNFLNSQFYFKDKITMGKKLVVNAGFFGNTDARNLPINQSLDPKQKQFLSAIGNNTFNAFYPSAIPDSFSQGRLLYRKVDTLYSAGKRDTVFVYEPRNSGGLFSLSFSEMGEGMGDYIVDTDLASNGKIYKWVAPDPITGKKKGKYEPVILLVAPKQQSIFTLSVLWNASENSDLQADFALSAFDPNRFSSAIDQNGNAAKIVFRNNKMLNKEKKLALKTALNAEYNSIGFKPIERLRTVEFTRDWGLDLVVQPAEERYLIADFKVVDSSGGSIDYLIGNYARNNDFNAFRHQFSQILNKNGWRMDNQISLTSFEDVLQKGRFFRPSANLSKTIPAFSNREFSLKYAVENNQTKLNTSQSLTAGSFSFSTFQLSTQSNPEKLNKWGLKYFTRADALPLGNLLQRADRSQNFNLNGEWMSDQHHQIRFNATYRKLNRDNIFSTEASDETILGRVEYFTMLWKGAISGSSLYELGSGQEPRKDFTYFEVPAGQGEYAWFDYNNDGLQQLNEFELAKFKDQARFIRIFTPTREFVRANYLNFNYNLVLDPSVALKNEENSKFANFFKRFYLQSSIQIIDKSTEKQERNLNPFSLGRPDTSLIITERLQSHSFSFNRQSQVWGIDLNYLNNISKSFLSYGFESRELSDLTLRIRSNWFKMITVDLIGKKTLNQLETPGFQNRNYRVISEVIEPRITYTYSTKLRLQAGYTLNEKRNNGIEKAIIKAVQLDGRYNIVSNTSIASRFSLNKINFNGLPSSTVGYIMLDGLLPGNNLIWSTDLTKRLGAFLEISIQYEGRKSQSSGMVHLGRAQVRALL